MVATSCLIGVKEEGEEGEEEQKQCGSFKMFFFLRWQKRPLGVEIHYI